MNEATWIEKMHAVEGTLYHVTCAMLREEYDRRDAMQETALRAWEKQSTLRREEYFGTWAVRICINVCKDIRRKSKPVVSTDDVPEIPAPQGDTDFAGLGALHPDMRAGFYGASPHAPLRELFWEKAP